MTVLPAGDPSTQSAAPPALSPSAAPGLPPGFPPLPPTFPPGVDPTTYKIEEVTRLLKAAAYLPIFNIPNPTDPNWPIPLFASLPQLLVAVRVHEQLHRFDVRMPAPGAQGLRVLNRVGEPQAQVQIRWTPMPWDYEAGPDREPSPTLLNPFCSQRFCMLDGQLDFLDGHGSGIRAFGSGRTFPGQANGQLRLYIGAAIEILEGLGRLEGLTGAMVVNGWIQPPHNLALNLMVRLMDPDGRLVAHRPMPPLVPAPNPDPDASFMFFLGEPDPTHPVELITGPDGRIVGSRVFEKLRRVHLSADVGERGIFTRTEEHEVVGTVQAELHFNFLDPLPVIPIHTTEGVFTFHGADGAPLGTVRADMVEGRAFRTSLAGAPLPVFRFAGFGPIRGGTGQFAGASGMMTMNSAISVFPRTLSNLYILRFEDPQGRYRLPASSLPPGAGGLG